jgi:hypothetical protein
MRTIDQILRGAVHVAEVARHFLARKHAPGSCAMPIEPGLLCDTELP